MGGATQYCLEINNSEKTEYDSVQSEAIGTILDIINERGEKDISTEAGI